MKILKILVIMIMNMIIRLSTPLVLSRCCLALLCAWRDTAALGWYRWHTLVPVSPPLVLVGETLWHILQACPNWGWWCHNCRIWAAVHFLSVKHHWNHVSEGLLSFMYILKNQIVFYHPHYSFSSSSASVLIPSISIGV